jgi:hypothetical protein
MALAMFAVALFHHVPSIHIVTVANSALASAEMIDLCYDLYVNLGFPRDMDVHNASLLRLKNRTIYSLHSYAEELRGAGSDTMLVDNAEYLPDRIMKEVVIPMSIIHGTLGMTATQLQPKRRMGMSVESGMWLIDDKEEEKPAALHM